ncbi:hypothetical protein J6590_095502, partial [Homalodisca vitripennis]
ELHMRLYIYKDSPSARWGLRPQAPMMYACKFGDKRYSGKGGLCCRILSPTCGLGSKELGKKDCTNDSHAIGLQRKACKSEKCETATNGSAAIEPGRSLHSRLTIFPQIRASSNGSPAIGLQRKACKSEKDSPSARWGLRPQAPMMYACKFGDKR